MARRRYSSESPDRKRRRHDSSDREERARRRSKEKRKRSEEKRQRDKDRRRKRTRSRSSQNRRTGSEDIRGRSRDYRNRNGTSKNYKDYRDKEKAVIENDKDGHLIYRKGDTIRPTDGARGTYVIQRDLGEGTFGKVVEVSDEKNKTLALKIIRNISKYREAAKYEIRVLKTLRSADPKGENLVISLVDYFDYHGHSCLVFPLLGQSVFDFLKDNDYYPFPIEQVRLIGYQLTKAVYFMHKNRLTHTDLKPENLMFRKRGHHSEQDSKGKKFRVIDDPNVVLIDLGGATFEDEHHTTIVSTRHYRAPEVILELGWSHPCDVWSIGCILFELYTGYTLFQTHDSREHLAIMERALGPMPVTMAEKTKTRHYKDGRLQWDAHSSDAKYVRDKCYSLRHHIRHEGQDYTDLFDVIELMLEYEPAKRITLDKALKEPFFEKVKEPTACNGEACNGGA